MGRLMIAAVALMGAVSCSTQQLANTNERINRNVETAVRDSVRIEASSLSIEDRVRTLSDRSLIRITYYYPPQDSSSQRGAVSAEMVIQNDVTSSDTSSKKVTETETVSQKSDSVTVDRSVIRTEVTEKKPLAWWQEALMWTGVAAIAAAAAYLVWKIWGTGIASAVKTLGKQLLNKF